MTDSVKNHLAVDIDQIGKGATLGCINHPGRETTLRCNRCDGLICPDCARKTPVGYRCVGCVRQQQSIFDTAVWHDYVVAAVISFVLSGLSGALMVRFGWFVIFLAPTVGGFISEIIRRAIGRRRGKYLSYVAVGCMLLAGLFNLTLWGIVYLAIASTTLYARLRSVSI
jgi:hypothetical protein